MEKTNTQMSEADRNMKDMTESTEQLSVSPADGSFQIVLDVVVTHTDKDI